MLDANDCRLWQLEIRALLHYFSVENSAPPSGGFRIKRWSAVGSNIGTAHTFYNYVILPTDAGAGWDQTVFHEFGHTLRFVADGSETHWHWDDLRFNYGHAHGSDLFNKGFAFSEGWAHFWSKIVRGLLPPSSSAPPPDLDWNEHAIGDRLLAMSGAVGPSATDAKFMMDLLLANPGALHTMYEFERAYCRALPSGTNAYCKNHAPERVHPPACPPDYTDDGATCRFNNVRTKPSSSRGAGTVPSSCGAGMEYDAGLCYPTCPAGYHGVATRCLQNCPAGYRDDGATCHRDAKIISANNDACPAYDKCGLVSAKGCSVCPAGYHNDGCTCRLDVHTFLKATTDRGVGQVPSGCAANLEYDAGLCYRRCPAGFHGVGPYCWGTCPSGFRDDGGTCYAEPHVFSDDPDN
jgi:hypothetical protein